MKVSSLNKVVRNIITAPRKALAQRAAAQTVWARPDSYVWMPKPKRSGLGILDALRKPSATRQVVPQSVLDYKPTADQAAIAARMLRSDHQAGFLDLEGMARAYGLTIKIYPKGADGRFYKPTVVGDGKKTIRLAFDNYNYARLSRFGLSTMGRRVGKLGLFGAATVRGRRDTNSAYQAVAEAAGFPMARELAKAYKSKSVGQLQTIAGILGIDFSSETSPQALFIASRNRMVSEMRRQAAAVVQGDTYGWACELTMDKIRAGEAWYPEPKQKSLI